MTETLNTEDRNTLLNLAREAITQVAPQAEIIELSSRTGAGLDAWISLLERLLA